MAPCRTRNRNAGLHDATKEIHGPDKYMTNLAETSVNVQAEDV